MNKTGVFFIGFGVGVVFMLVVLVGAAVVLGLFAYHGVTSQFQQASAGAQESVLISDLGTVRSQLQLYNVQHLDKYPSQLASVGTDGRKFVEQLTRKTDAEGNFSKSIQAAPYGPYLQQFPTNSFARNDSSVKIGKAPCPGDGSSDWYFCTESNKFSPNDAGHKDQ
jgi:hypothetical protein